MLEILWPYLKYVFGFIGVVAVTEIFISARWWPVYFISGIPVYRHTLKVGAEAGRVPSAEQIEAAIPDSGWGAPIHVRPIAENRFAFRESMLHFNIGYTPVMHGSLRYDEQAGEIVVRGYANLSAALFAVFFVLAPLTLPLEAVDFVFPLFLVGVFLWIYWIQAKRFRQVGEAAQRMWSEG
jgi:hypothetical protein